MSIEGAKARLAIFASGGGSNARVIMNYFKDHPSIRIALVVYNRKDAGVRAYADEFSVPAVYRSNRAMEDEQSTMQLLDHYRINGIVLAGYLALIPPYLVDHFPDAILNIHPALLPSFGGKGMYGRYVHEAVSRSGHSESGVTIHLVNKEYDRGKILFQQPVPITPFQDPAGIGRAVLIAEHASYSGVIETYFSGFDFSKQ